MKFTEKFKLKVAEKKKSIIRNWANRGGWIIFWLITVVLIVFGISCFCNWQYARPFYDKLLVILAALFVPYATFKINEANYLKEALAQYATKDMGDDVRLLYALSHDWEKNAENKDKDVADGILVPPNITTLRSHASNSKPSIGNITKYTAEKGKRNLPWTQEQDAARRRVKHYFLNNLKLYQAGRISTSAFMTICDKGALEVLFTTIEVMEYILKSGYTESEFKDIVDVTKFETPQPKPDTTPRIPCFWNPATKKYEAS